MKILPVGAFVAEITGPSDGARYVCYRKLAILLNIHRF